MAQEGDFQQDSQGYDQLPQGSSTSLRDIEERQRLLKDRLLLLGQTLIDERDKTFQEIQDLKTLVLDLKSEYARLADFVKRITELTDQSARKEELQIIQRQLDMIRK